MDPLPDRMPPLARETMDDLQRAAADELIAGPRKGVKGPFIPLMRSPRLLAPLQKVGEYLRFNSALSRRVSSSPPSSYHDSGPSSSNGQSTNRWRGRRGPLTKRSAHCASGVDRP
jgi:hypothetical protein